MTFCQKFDIEEVRQQMDKGHRDDHVCTLLVHLDIVIEKRFDTSLSGANLLLIKHDQELLKEITPICLEQPKT